MARDTRRHQGACEASPRPQRRRRLGQAPKHGTSIFTLQDYSKGLIEAIGFQGQRVSGSSGGGLCKRLPGFEGSRSTHPGSLPPTGQTGFCRPGSGVQEVQAAVAQPCGDGQVESRRAMQSPVRDIHIGRPAALRSRTPSSGSPSWSERGGKRPGFSTSGWSPAAWALAAKTERKRLWRLVLSPPHGQPSP